MSLRGSTHRRGNLRALVALAALACALLGALPALAGAASISGRVTEAGSEAPLAARVLVVKLQNGVPQSFAGGAETNPANGAYTVANLPAGEFELEFAGPRNYFVQYYDEKRHAEEATVLTLAAEDEKANVDAALERGGSISGTVTAAATGAPANSVSVCAFDEQGVLRACDETDASGSYLVGPFETGDYRLQFAPFDEESLMLEYYADKPTLEEATPIHVLTGEAVAEKDAALLAPPHPTLPASSAPIFSTPPPPLEFALPAPIAPHRLHCRRGFRKRKVKGKQRCVKIHKKRHHRRAAR